MTKLIDKSLLFLIATVVLAVVLPISGQAAKWFSLATEIFIGALFFLHGAKLPWSAVVAGILHWRLHLVVLLATFVLFPVLGLLAGVIVPGLKETAFYLGILYLCILPSTVQSSIAFTSIAGGNVPAAIVSASVSNVLGMFLTPLLATLLFAHSGQVHFSMNALKSIMFELLLPFIAGQLLQHWVGHFIRTHKKLTSIVDRGSILMVVYLAFSEAMVEKLWNNISTHDLVLMVVINCVLLALVLLITWYGSKLLRFNEKDRITITFCGSKKSLASGAPMANAIFSGASVGIGAIILPLMLFHQIQLMACTVIANHIAQSRKNRNSDG